MDEKDKASFAAAVVAANDAMNEVGEIVGELNQFHTEFDGDLEFNIDRNGRLEAWVCGAPLF